MKREGEQQSYEMWDVAENVLSTDLRVRSEILGQLALTEPLHESDVRWLTDSMLAGWLGVDEETVQEIFDTLGAEPRYVGTGASKRVTYTDEDVSRLNDEIRWMQLPEEVGITHIANEIGRSIPITKRLIETLDIEPVGYSNKMGRTAPRYDRTVIGLIRDFDRIDNLPAGDWLNYAQLTDELHVDREWAMRRLQEADIKPELRRNPATGRTIEYFPPESKDVVRRAIEERPPAASEGWLTKEAIERALGKSINWVEKRLEKYEDTQRTLLDTQQVPRAHFPHFVLDELRQELATIEATPEAGNYLSTKGVAKALGKSQLWVENRIEEFEDFSEIRKDSKGRLHPHYPPVVLEALRDKLHWILSHPEAGDHLSISDLATETGRSRYWVQKRLGQLTVESELRRNSKDELREHFPPETVNALKNLDKNQNT